MINKYIPIIFAFDNNFSIPAIVVIKSLLINANQSTIYKVYCVISSDVEKKNIDIIETLFTNKNHQVEFINASMHFEGAYIHRGISLASYYRLMIHELIPNEDKIIYADIDVLFNGDLKDVFETDIKDNIIAGVKNLYIYQVFDKLMNQFEYWRDNFYDMRSSYINGGFLVMNLKVIRETMIWKQWIKLSKNKWEFHDQDIINYTCKNKIYYLPPKYNMTFPLREPLAFTWGLFEKKLINEEPIVYHFTATKPWNSKYSFQSDVWWNFVREHTDLYNYFYENYKKNIDLKTRFVKLVKNRLLYIKYLIK